MKKHLFYFLAVIMLFNFTNCSTKFKIAAPYKNYTIIYALLDMSDTAHYVRIEKSFMDPVKSSLTMAQNPDSSFFSNLNVMIKEMDMSETIVSDTIHLNRVDLNLEGYPKQPGIFFFAPNYAYKFTNSLNAGNIYRLIVTNLSTHEVDSSETPVFDDRITDINPANNQPFFSSYNFETIKDIVFSDTGLKYTVGFSAQYTSVPDFKFENIASPLAISQAVIRFNWLDSDIVTNSLTAHSFDYNAGYCLPVFSGNTAHINFNLADLRLYEALRDGMGQAPAGIIRLLDTFSLYIYISTQDYVTYVNSQLIQGVGLTGNVIQPVNTNIKGQNVLGLFTSRGKQQGTLYVSEETLDSLELSPLLTITHIGGRVH